MATTAQLNIDSPQERMMIFGSFGYGNVGDEAVPMAFQQLLVDAESEGSVVPVSRFKSADMDGVVYTTPDKNPLISEAVGKPITLCGGGIVEPGKFSCLRRLFEQQKLYGKLDIRAFAVSADHSTDYSFLERRLVRRALGSLPRVHARDDCSQEVLSKLLPATPVTLVGDIALNLRRSGSLPEKLEQKLPERFLCVTLAAIRRDEEFLSWLGDAIVALAEKLDAAVVMAPMSTLRGDDVKQHLDFAKRIQEKNSALEVVPVFCEQRLIQPEVFAEVLARSILNVSTRLHGCVSGYPQETPFVAITYHPKVFGFARTVGGLDFMVPARRPQTQPGWSRRGGRRRSQETGRATPRRVVNLRKVNFWRKASRLGSPQALRRLSTSSGARSGR